MDARRKYFRAESPVDEPLLAPHRFERACGHLANRCRDIRVTKGAETKLGVALIIKVRIVKIARGSDTTPHGRGMVWPLQENKHRVEVSLEEHIDVHPPAEIPPIPNVNRILGEVARHEPTVS